MPGGNSKRFHIRKPILFLSICLSEINFLVDLAFSKWIGLLEEIPGNERGE